HIVDSLPAWVDRVLLAVNYKREALEAYFETADPEGRVVLVDEPQPLGTGGALKNLGIHLDETFLAFNGDIVSSIDLARLLRNHRAKKGIGTIALWPVPDPSAFGAVGTGPGLRITMFQEKPPPGAACSDLINAGVYAFEPEILDHIGDGFVSLEREVFPKVLEHGLFGHRFEGYWIDCGTRENFLRAQRTLLDLGGGGEEGAISDGARVTPPNFLRGIDIEEAAVGPYVSAQEGVVVRRGAEVSDSILMHGALIGEGARVQGSILGPDVAVADGAQVRDTILG
ncbi:MAG: NDP-sugar synthase, partial [Euryarchaeota archaeon]|nr:NDP-sugar synthase [Euryarchaeota archaeon]